MDTNIKHSVMNNEMIKYLLEQIKDEKEKQKTIEIVSSFLEDFQSKASVLLTKMAQPEQDSKK